MSGAFLIECMISLKLCINLLMRSIINEKNLNNKKILLRLDLNVPLERDKITDTTESDKNSSYIKFLIKEKAKSIILSHVGRPKGKIVKELSLKPICEELQHKLRKSKTC